ncbi:hypothetical protein LPAF129_03930 [Ligilactobacillus pabuli]|uniref:VRR-NUC domain-containing protein n=1 Tax=Ligilactobacillus pabuli TaxID=2886039 RepID=A0ABQ5JF81_9LACO|nr:VRR-NUC domain-containing protein [Ligilactobacillus pabuli]GKS80708.1 hypothetical protein LPAF129_03930 [Ligilactobacillus pabuli]
MKSEAQIQNEILVALSKCGCTVIRTNAGQARTMQGRIIKLAPRGWPDITGFRKSDGRMLLVEVKNEKGRLRPDQVKFQEFISQYPVLYGVCRSAEDAIKLVEDVNNAGK